MRVLAADDDQGILNTLERCLKSWGYDAITARDGIEAWRLLKREDAPRIVVLDWDMPGISGLEVCRLLRTAPQGEDFYVLMLTGRQEKGDLIEALEAGADDFLSKPFHARELQLRLAKGVSFQTSRAASSHGGGGTQSLTAANQHSKQPHASPLPQQPPPSGSTLGGKFRLEKKIAEGGMASVWLGVHLSLGINVAIKFMKPGLSETPDYASFEREARAAAQLRTEHIVRVYDHGIAHDGAPYLVMEYLAGETFADRIDRRGALPAPEVVAIVEQIGRALIEAHKRGIIHRDIKPENILITEDPERPYGIAKLADFGLARSWANAQKTEGGLISGTPSYMTPEHLRAQAAPNPLLDLWGLAATAFTAMTGAVPFDGDTLSEVMKKVCVEPLPVPSSLNRALTPAVDAWFARACARAPGNRFQSAAELTSAFTIACCDVLPYVVDDSTVGAIGKLERSGVPTESESESQRTLAMQEAPTGPAIQTESKDVN